VVSIALRNVDGSWHGYMLDSAVFVAALKQEGATPERARVLQVGAGGAGSAIAIALIDAVFEDWCYTMRMSRGVMNWLRSYRAWIAAV